MISRLLFNRVSTSAILALAAAPVFAQEGAEAPVEEAASSSGGTGLMDMISGAGPIGIVLIILSIIALALAIENFVSLKRDKLAPPELVDELEAFLSEAKEAQEMGDMATFKAHLEEAMELCETEQTLLTRTAAAGIAKVGHSFDTIEKALEEMGDEEAVKLHQKIGWLSVIANVAPMMGLLGTVSGMVAAFNVIATQKNPNPSDLASGISTALLTTMFGLVVAIPTTAAFAFLRNNLVRSVIEVGAMVEDLFERFRSENA